MQGNLPVVSLKKYNDWRQKRCLICADPALYQRATRFFTQTHLGPSERAAFYLHELTGCEGLEFVAFSNAKLKRPVTLANEVILVPCFMSEMEGQNVQDPLVWATMYMERKSRFVYDGWIPITTWDEESVRRAVQKVDEALSIFCMRGRTFFEWEPKYPAPEYPQSNYEFGEEQVQELESIAQALDSLGEDDRNAMHRSLAWLSQGIRLNEPAARFLFSMLSIESLATYIEKNTSGSSPLASLKVSTVTEYKRDECIRTTLSSLLGDDPRKAIEKAYFDCVITITRRLKDHLAHVFASDTELYELLFEQRVDGKTLYDLRHHVAHGEANALSERQREQIRQRVWDTERVARRYIWAVFEQALGVQPISDTIKATFFLDIQNSVASKEGIHRGPTHMAIIYTQ